MQDQQPTAVVHMMYVKYIFATGIVDSSGVRFFYTDQPPDQKAEILVVGHNVVGHMIIPPRVEKYTIYGYCSQRCTNAVSNYILCSLKSVNLHTYMHV